MPVRLRPNRPFLLVLFAGIIAASPVRATESAPAETSLQARLDQILSEHKQSKAQLGARVIELPGGRIIYDHKGHLPVIPASNMKMIVMAGAIARLGKNYRFTTILAIRGKDLVVIGGGDPTFGDERLAQDRKQTITSVFHDWAEKLTAAGVKQVAGNLIIDDSLFDRQFTHPRWPEDQIQNWYEAPIGGLNFNANCATVRVQPTTASKPAEVSFVPANNAFEIINKTTTGPKQTVVAHRNPDSSEIIVSGTVAKAELLGPITISDPGLYFGHIFKSTLAAKGIRVQGQVVRERIRLEDGSVPNSCRIVTQHSAPLADALARAGKNSLGMMAEGLIKILGQQKGGTGSWENGNAAIRGFLTELSIPTDQFVIDDGSGLSRNDRLSPAASTLVLRNAFVAGNGAFELLRDSLACPGRDGTLEKRMREPATKDRIFAKTGYIKGVCTLSGYIHTASGQWLAFAIYYNQINGPGPFKQAQDEACRLLVKWPEIEKDRTRP